MIGEMYLARRGVGSPTVIYPVNIRTLPRAWHFTPPDSPELGERVFALRQRGVAALDNSPAAALAALNSIA